MTETSVAEPLAGRQSRKNPIICCALEGASVRSVIETTTASHPETWVRTPPSSREPRFWAYLLGPVALVVLSWIPLRTIGNQDHWLGLVGLLILYLAPLAAKGNLIPLAVSTLHFPWWVIGGYFVIMGVAICLFFILNYDHTKRIPFLGKWISDFERNGARRIAANRWMHRLGIIALTAVMFLALDGSGAAIVSIVGRGVGYRPRQLLPMVLAGSLLSSMPIAYGSEVVLQLLNRFGDPRVLMLILSIVLITITLTLMRRATAPTPTEIPSMESDSPEE